MEVIVAFWLCFTRWSAIIVQLPLFEDTSIPVIIKVLASLVLSYAFFPLVQNSLLNDVAHIGENSFWLLSVFYALTGVMIGFFVKAIMHLYTAAGSIITQQAGFGAVRYFDPTAGQQIGPFEKLISLTILVFIITSGALLPMLKGIVASFASINIINFSLIAKFPIYFLELFKSLFLSALLLASPIIFVNMLVMSILGIVARTVPQMNILMVSFVVNIGLGLLVFATSSSEFFGVAFKIYVEKLGNWFQFMT